jgi:argininosuccinate lyase
MRMYLKEEIKDIKKLVFNLLEVILEIAKNNTDTIMPGYTHLQKAQPITFAHHVMAYFEMLKRDISRLDDTYKRTNCMPLGAGALATTTYPLDREYLAELLDFDNICLNSIDAVSDRDYCIELINSLSMLMMHLSRFSEEIILWCSNEIQFVELDDAYSTGSSIMPQKKNPDIAELVRGKTGRVYGSLIGLLTTIKSLPLAYNKDMQEDKEATFDAIDTVKMCLPIFTDMLRTMKINKKNMYNGASGGFTNATDAADYLVKKNLPFRDAHEVIGKLVLYCVNNNKNLEDMILDEYKSVSPIFEDDIYEAISLETCVNKRNVIGGPSKEMMLNVININQEYLDALFKTID